MMRRQRDPQLEQFWRQTLAKWQQSGQTIRGFCVQQQLSQPNFYAWKRELVKRDAERVGAVNGGAGPRRAVGPQALPLVPVRIVAEAIIEVVLPTGVVVRVPGGVEVVAQLVARLGAASC